MNRKITAIGLPILTGVLVLSLILLVTKLNQLGTRRIAPSAPESRPAAQTALPALPTGISAVGACIVRTVLPSPTPTSTLTPIPTPTVTPSSTPTATQTPTAIPTVTPPRPTSTLTPTVTPSSTPTATQTPKPPTSTPTPTPTQTPIATQTPLPTATNTPISTPTATPPPAGCTEIIAFDQSGQRVTAAGFNALKIGDEIRFEVNTGNITLAEGAAVRISINNIVRDTLYLTQTTAGGFTSDFYRLPEAGQYKIEAFIYSQGTWR